MRNANFAFKCARSFYKMRARNLMSLIAFNAIEGEKIYSPMLNFSKKQVRVITLEKEIDLLVYKLYDLTTEEIAIVENFYNGK